MHPCQPVTPGEKADPGLLGLQEKSEISTLNINLILKLFYFHTQAHSRWTKQNVSQARGFPVHNLWRTEPQARSVLVRAAGAATGPGKWADLGREGGGTERPPDMRGRRSWVGDDTPASGWSRK